MQAVPRGHEQHDGATIHGCRLHLNACPKIGVHFFETPSDTVSNGSINPIMGGTIRAIGVSLESRG